MIKQQSDIKIVFISGYTQNELQIGEILGKNLLGFCYKPYDENDINNFISAVTENSSVSVRMQTFPSFDMYVNEKIVVFPRSKSKELMAILVDHRGSTVTMGEAIACLWPEKEDALAKRLYRDAVVRLRLIINKYGLPRLIKFGRASLSLDTDNVTCDMWEFIDNKSDGYFGEYLVNYDWSLEKQSYLDSILDSRN